MTDKSTQWRKRELESDQLAEGSCASEKKSRREILDISPENDTPTHYLNKAKQLLLHNEIRLGFESLWTAAWRSLESLWPRQVVLECHGAFSALVDYICECHFTDKDRKEWYWYMFDDVQKLHTDAYYSTVERRTKLLKKIQTYYGDEFNLVQRFITENERISKGPLSPVMLKQKRDKRRIKKEKMLIED